MNKSSNGVALITVLLVVFLVSVTATSLAALQQLNTRRSTLLAHQQQAKLYVLGAEQWASRILLRDAKSNNRDYFAEDWAVLAPVLPVQGGTVSGSLQDLQARFNLNNLLTAEGKTNQEQRLILQRLLQLLELDTGLADAIIDWLDEDQQVRFPDGAEDGEYLSSEPVYLAANQRFYSVSELRLIKGIDRQVFSVLSPNVTALPEFSTINLNTASAAIIAASSEKLTLSSAEELLNERTQEGYSSVAEFMRLAGLSQEDVDLASLGLSSQFFLLHAKAQIGSVQLKLSSLLRRTSEGSVHALIRSFGEDW